MNHQIGIVFAILLIPLSLSQAVHADDNNQDIFDCESKYKEFLEIGEISFTKRYQYSADYKNCHALFKNPIWNTGDPNRIKVLSELISFLNGEKSTRNVRDRPEIKELVTPQWIKTDAKMWYEGKQTDSRFAYGIRYLIESKIVIPPTIILDKERDCPQNKICLTDGDYIKYSITGNKIADTITIKDSFGKTKNDSIEVSSVKITREGKETVNFLLNLNTGMTNNLNENNQCCKKYTLAHSIPIIIGSKIISNEPVSVLENTILDHQGLKRNVLVARNSISDYIDIIDEKSGVVFLSEYKQKDYWKKIELIESNLFLEKKGIQYNQLEIPKWLKNTTKWWAEGAVPDREYFLAIEYLMGKNFLVV